MPRRKAIPLIAAAIFASVVFLAYPRRSHFPELPNPNGYDVLIREAYRIALEKGNKGEAAKAQRAAKFEQSKKIEAVREGVRTKYKALRDEKLALEKQRNELKRKRVPAAAPTP